MTQSAAKAQRRQSGLELQRDTQEVPVDVARPSRRRPATVSAAGAVSGTPAVAKAKPIKAKDDIPARTTILSAFSDAPAGPAQDREPQTPALPPARPASQVDIETAPTQDSRVAGFPQGPTSARVPTHFEADLGQSGRIDEVAPVGAAQVARPSDPPLNRATNRLSKAMDKVAASVPYLVGLAALALVPAWIYALERSDVSGPGWFLLWCLSVGAIVVAVLMLRTTKPKP
jgi:hypothetical protein